MQVRHVAALAAALVLVCTGCSGVVKGSQVKSAEGTITGLTVSGDPGSEPGVRMAAPLAVASTRTEVTVTGTGAPILVDQLFVLELTVYDARTGVKAFSTYDAGQHAVAAKTTGDTLFPKLSAALVGKTQGSRVVMAMAAADAFAGGGVPPAGVRPSDPVVLVADVVAVPPVQTISGPSGRSVAPGPGTPRLTVGDNGPESITTRGLVAPRGLEVVRLIDGTGPPVRARSLVTLNYLGQQWGASEPFEDTYFKEPDLIALGTGMAPPAWEQALVGLRRGSRVLVMAPSALAGVPGGGEPSVHGTIAWVIDVLGVS